MQKVSKQSLAMLALSILLAISIALTFTFAAAQVSKTATGTITFSGEYFIAWSGNASGDTNITIDTTSNGNIEFSLTEACFTLEQQSDGTVDATLNSTGTTALKKVSVMFTNATNTAVTPTIAKDDTSSTQLVATFNTMTEVGANSSSTVTLDAIIETLAFQDIDGSQEYKFVVKATMGV